MNAKGDIMIERLNLPVLADADIVVVGGGPSGVAAALAAARGGAKVLLLEQFGALGGLATSGVVPMFAPTSDGERMIYGGLFAEINTEMCRRMGIEPWQDYWQAINPEILKRLLDEMAESAKIRFVFGAKVCEAEVEAGRINAVWVATSMGLKRVTGRRFIDGTGDALLAALAGAGFEFGDENGRTMSPTLCAQFSNIDFEAAHAASRAGASDHDIWRKMTAEGTAPFQEYHFVCMKPISATTANSNLGHIYGGDTLDEEGLTRCYIEGRKIVHTFEKFYREHVPGFENVELISSAALLGVRETRRIDGEYRMTFEDFRRRADFEDEIGRCCYPVDIHSASTDSEEQKKVEQVLEKTSFKHGESYGIPYRAMIPKKRKNLLVPGRALSSDRAIQSSLRVMPPCFVTGQAAGIAAGLAGDGDVRSVNTDELRSILREIGAFFH